MIGADKAKALIFNAELIDAGESLRLGLVTKVVPHGELMAYTMEYAEKLANKAPQALGLAKLVILNAINTDAGVGSVDTYDTVFFGMNALGKAISKDIELAVHEDGSDPHRRSVFIGWYGVYKFAIVDQNALTIITSASSKGAN